MAQIPTWLLGRHLTTVTITPQTVGADGTLSDAGTGSLYGQINSVQLASDPAKENISAVTRPYANMVIVEDNTSLELEEILQNSSNAEANLLPQFANLYDIAKFVFVRGQQSYTYYGSRGRFEDGVTSKGKNVCRLTLEQIDIGSANPVYASV